MCLRSIFAERTVLRHAPGPWLSRVASEVCALLAFSAIRNNDRVGLILGGLQIERIVPPKKGEKTMRVIREILSPVAGTQSAPVATPAGAFPRRGHRSQGAARGARLCLRRRSVAFVVSDFFAQGYERALALARLRQARSHSG